MRMKCLGCGTEYESSDENELCPRPCGNGHACGCLAEPAAETVTTEAEKPRKDGKKWP